MSQIHHQDFEDFQSEKKRKKWEAYALEKIDAGAETLSKRMGHEGETNWKLISKVVIIVYLLFTMLSCYYRPDFMSLTAVCGALFFFEKP